MPKIVCPININTKAKAKNYFRGINFTLISVPTVVEWAYVRDSWAEIPESTILKTLRTVNHYGDGKSLRP